MQLTSELNSCGCKCRKSCFTQVGCTRRAVELAEPGSPTTGFSFFSLIRNLLGCFRIVAQCSVLRDRVKPPLKARDALSDVIQIVDVNVKWASYTHTHTHTHALMWSYCIKCNIYYSSKFIILGVSDWNV